MADTTLQSRAALGAFSMRFSNTSVEEITDLAIHSIALPIGSEQAGKDKVRAVLSLDWPDTGACSTSGDGKTRLLGLQQDACFVLQFGEPASTQAGFLDSFDAAAYLTDQSDSWVALHIDGPSAIAALERICPLDLHIESMPAGSVARTSMEHLSTIIVRLDENGFLLMSPSSSARSFLHAVETSFRNIA